MGGELDADIINFNNVTSSGSGGSIGGNAAINLNITNALSSGGAANFQISNESNVAGSPGGTIGGDATINVSAGNIAANSLVAQIDNSNGGNIGGSADHELTSRRGVNRNPRLSTGQGAVGSICSGQRLTSRRLQRR